MRANKPMSPARHVVLFLLALLFGGCAALEPVAPRQWEAHRAQLAGMQDWTARGKVALRSADAAESATLVWRQQGAQTDLELSGPLGVGATAIRSDGHLLYIRRGDEHRTLDISTPDAIRQSTGWDLPLQALTHWLKGLPSPDSTVQGLDLDPDTGLLRHLEQDDWDVHYQKYGEFGGLTLPRRLQIKRGPNEAKVVIADWQTSPG